MEHGVRVVCIFMLAEVLAHEAGVGRFETSERSLLACRAQLGIKL